VKDDQRPVLVGVAQSCLRDAEPASAPTPLGLLEAVARGAVEDSGAGGRALRELDTVAVVEVVAWRSKNAPHLLAEKLGATPRHEILTATGGEIPITLVNELARRIAAGKARVALVAGANAIRTFRRARRAGVKLDWGAGGEGEATLFGVHKPGSTPLENEYGLRMPPDIYPIFENALRARRGLDRETHRRRMGALMSRFTQVAAKNPHAWFPVARSADELTQPSRNNRMIAFPYTKYLNAVMETDQAAAVLLMSAAAARELGVPEDRWVHWWGGAHAEEEAWFPSERPDFGACPSLRDAATGALAEAGLALDEIDCIDFYSCFPVAVEMACEMLGLDESDPRGFTVTGGLPYAGGPGNNYTLHSLAAMAERLRARPGAKGLVTGNGWYLTKHAASVWSTLPREKSGAPLAEPSAAEQARRRPLAPVAEARGEGTVEAYTVLYDREGEPTRGIVLGRTQTGDRFIANTPDDRASLEAFLASHEVGSVGKLSSHDGHNRFEPV
jgi:acetyl-CoA C-acetyltransferase